MNLRNTHHQFGLVSRLLHWLIAVIFISLIPIGWYMTGLSDEEVLYWRLLDLHLALGLCLFILVPLKLLWRWISPNPPLSPALAVWERYAARTVHGILLAAMIVLPVTGFLFIASNGDPITLYDLFEIPDIGGLSKPMRSALSGVHYYLAYACAALIVVHAAAAFKHRFLDAGQVLRRTTL